RRKGYSKTKVTVVNRGGDDEVTGKQTTRQRQSCQANLSLVWRGQSAGRAPTDSSERRESPNRDRPTPPDGDPRCRLWPCNGRCTGSSRRTRRGRTPRR